MISKTVYFLILLFSASLSARGQWIHTNDPGNTNVEAIATDGTHLFAGTFNGGVYLSMDNGNSWTQVNNGLTNTIVYALEIIGTRVFAGTSGGGIFYSDDYGSSWIPSTNGIGIGQISDLAKNGNTIYAAKNNGVFVSTDLGNSWTDFTSGITEFPVLSLAISGTTIYAGTGNGVFYSENGAAWIGMQGMSFGAQIDALAAMGNVVFAGTHGGGVWQSQNNGNWTWIGDGMTYGHINDLFVSGDKVFAGSDGGGVYLLDTLGTPWSQINVGLTNHYVRSFASSGNTLYAGTHGGGVFKNNSALIGIDELENNDQLTFYPNPITSESKLYLNTSLKNAELIICSVSGKEIYSGIEFSDACELENIDLEKGIYLLIAKNKNSQIIKKLIVQ